MVNNLTFTHISAEDLAGFLIPLGHPVMEIDIIKKFFDFTPGSSDTTGLFSMHFSVFNALYRLKQEYGRLGYYVHIDPMRIRMIKPPKSGCGYYYEDDGRFCNKESAGGEYCHVHRKYYNKNSILVDILRDFYLDPQNIDFGESELLRKLLDGTFKFARNRIEIENAKLFFGLAYPSKKTIRKRYRELAAEYHPDKNNGSENAMKELNRAYETLREVYIL